MKNPAIGLRNVVCLVCLTLFPASRTSGTRWSDVMATGFKIGEVDAESAVIWTRRTAPAPDRIAATGAAGEMQVAWWPVNQLGDARTTPWAAVTAEGDGVHQFHLEGLTPRTRYVLEVRTRRDIDDEGAALRGAFTTAPAATQSAPVSFVVVTGQDYHRRDDGALGHRVYASMRAMQPDFFVHTGDVVYYDKGEPLARDVATARQHWGRTSELPHQRAFHLETPSYFIKDDHDTLKNDCWPGQSYGELTFAQGVALFREQTPAGERPYRRARWGEHLEVWLLEGREFRSANNGPDGPGKTILGDEQLAWLKRTLAASEATFRIVVSATPIVGPDRGNKADNHANAAFAHEGQRLRQFLAEQPGTIVVCGDRHWQYASIDPKTGLREFSCGPTTDAHAGGFSQRQRTEAHTYLAVRGGFLSVSVSVSVEPGDEAHRARMEAHRARMVIRHHDPDGAVLHEEHIAAP